VENIGEDRHKEGKGREKGEKERQRSQSVERGALYILSQSRMVCSHVWPSPGAPLVEWHVKYPGHRFAQRSCTQHRFSARPGCLDCIVGPGRVIHASDPQELWYIQGLQMKVTADQSENKVRTYTGTRASSPIQGN